MERITITGNVGKDAEMRYLPDGTPVADFPVAVNYTKKDGTKVAKWFKVTCWNKLAEVASQYVTKSMRVLVEGVVKADPYIDKVTGEAKASLVITARTVEFQGGGKHDDAPTGIEDQDEIPF